MKEYTFKAKIWKHKGAAGWYFVTLPRTLAVQIRKNHGLSEEGWGRLKSEATVGSTRWMTAIWYDSKAKSYLLPLKAAVRKAEKLEVGDGVKVFLRLRIEEGRGARWLKPF